MNDENWQSARLIPTSGITGTDEAERRATSAVLAVMGSVKEFGVAMTKPLGAPSGVLETFIEVPFKTGPEGEATAIPDGLVRTGRAGKTWTALVEVKTGSSTLERAQIESYLDVARDNGFQAVVTISNEMPPAPGLHPVDVDKRKLKKVALHHFSWAEVLTIAVQQRVHRGVSDPDQAWILGELIRYLEHPKSGALDFSDMGQEWVAVREAVAAGTLRANDKGLAPVVQRWEQLLRYEALRLGRELGVDAQVQLSRKELADPTIRFAAQAESLVRNGCLTGTLRIPDAVAPLDVTADLRSGRVTVSVDVDAPKEGRSTTRVNWIVRQLKDARDGIRIDGFVSPSKPSTSALLANVRENPALILDPSGRDIRLFRVAAVSPMGAKRGTGRGGFIDSVVASIDGFYGEVVQKLRPWAAKAPQLPAGGKSAAESAGIDVVPPPGDFTEEADQIPAYAVAAHAGAVSREGSQFVGAVEGAEPDVLDPDAVESGEPVDTASPAGTAGTASLLAPNDTVGLVSWDEAQARLDRERDPRDDNRL
jgi:hypothetical protein